MDQAETLRKQELPEDNWDPDLDEPSIQERPAFLDAANVPAEFEYSASSGYSDSKSKIIGIIVIGTLLAVLAGWYFSDKVFPEAEPQPTHFVTAAGLNCREEPTTRSAVVMQYAQDDQIVSSEERNGWIKSQNECWVSGSYVNEIAAEQVTAGATLAAAEDAAASSAQDTPVSTEPVITKNAASVSVHEIKYATYQNVRYRYSICFPPDLLEPQPESDNGDGRSFVGANGSELSVWGSYNVFDETNESAKEEDKSNFLDRGFAITYEFIGKDWYVLTGNKGDTIFYRKSFVYPDKIVSFEITYHSEDAPIFDVVTESLARCIRSGE